MRIYEELKRIRWKQRCIRPCTIDYDHRSALSEMVYNSAEKQNRLQDNILAKEIKFICLSLCVVTISHSLIHELGFFQNEKCITDMKLDTLFSHLVM
jgi:hypothetical protein